jgi:hypothetical protein
MSRTPFSYALVRAVPRVDRGESVNVGVIVYCQPARFLDCAIVVDEHRLRCLDPDVDVAAVAEAAEALREMCRDSQAGRAMGLGERFGWLTAPRSTIVQPGPVHAGLTDDPAAELARLSDVLVRSPRRP